MRKATFGERLRYAFDKSLSGGTISLIGWLALASVLIVLVATAILLWTGIAPDAPEGQDPQAFSLAEAFWQSLMRSLDPGTLAGDTGWKYRALMLTVTVGGIFIVSLLISVLSSGLQSKLEELRKGRSFVVEENHTLILGWSLRIFLIVSELVIANENQKKPRIVILADRDKVEMEEEIRAKVGDTKNTLVVCRSGNTIDLVDLEIVNPHAAKSIIILSPSDTEDADAQVIKMILAITNNPHRRPEPYHIVAEIRDEKNMEVARIVEMTDRTSLFELPLHPYTEALLSAVPIPKSSAKGRKRVILTGDVPSPINPPPGCHLHARCPYAMPRCKTDVPALREVTPGHFASCHLHDGGVKVPLGAG